MVKDDNGRTLGEKEMRSGRGTWFEGYFGGHFLAFRQDNLWCLQPVRYRPLSGQ